MTNKSDFLVLQSDPQATVKYKIRVLKLEDPNYLLGYLRDGMGNNVFTDRQEIEKYITSCTEYRRSVNLPEYIFEIQDLEEGA